MKKRGTQGCRKRSGERANKQDGSGGIAGNLRQSGKERAHKLVKAEVRRVYDDEASGGALNSIWTEPL